MRCRMCIYERAQGRQDIPLPACLERAFYDKWLVGRAMSKQVHTRRRSGCFDLVTLSMQNIASRSRGPLSAIACKFQSVLCGCRCLPRKLMQHVERCRGEKLHVKIRPMSHRQASRSRMFPSIAAICKRRASTVFYVSSKFPNAVKNVVVDVYRAAMATLRDERRLAALAGRDAVNRACVG